MNNISIYQDPSGIKSSFSYLEAEILAQKLQQPKSLQMVLKATAVQTLMVFAFQYQDP